MLKEPADEFHDVERHGPPPSASAFFVLEKDPAVFDLDDAMV